MPSESLPRKTFARKIVTMHGYGREDAAVEIASIDRVDQAEALRRFDLAVKQHVHRSVGQTRRHRKAKDLQAQCRELVLNITRRAGLFACPENLKDVSGHAGWGVCIEARSTGRAYVDFVLPLAREGMIAEKRDGDDKLLGYTLTDAGLAYLNDDTA